VARQRHPRQKNRFHSCLTWQTPFLVRGAVVSSGLEWPGVSYFFSLSSACVLICVAVVYGAMTQYKQEALLSLRNRPTFMHADVKIYSTQNATKHSFPCCAVENCPLVNDSDLLAWFCDIYLPLSHLTPSVRAIPSSYRIRIWCGKTRMAGLKSGDGRKTIDSSRLGTMHQRDRHTDSHVATANANVLRQGFDWVRWD